MAERRSARLAGAGPSGTSEEESGPTGGSTGEVPVFGMPAPPGADTIPEIWRTIHQMMQLVQNQQNQQPAPIIVQAPEHARPEPGVKQFLELRPTTFSGLGGPLEAEEWLRNTEAKLAAARIPQAGWVEVAQLQLTDNAANWWATKELQLAKPVPWGTFKEMVLAKYFPDSASNELMKRFAHLKQGGMTIDEYEAHFEMLSRFAPHMVETEKLKVYQFRQGLSPRIRVALAPSSYATLADIVEAARNFEDEFKLTVGQQSGGMKKPMVPARPGNRPPPGPTHNVQFKKPGTPGPVVKKMCNHCGKPGHLEKDCRRKLGLCLVCGAPDHAAVNCPKKQPGAAKPMYVAPLQQKTIASGPKVPLLLRSRPTSRLFTRGSRLF